MKLDFESVERPTLEIEVPEEKALPTTKLQKCAPGAVVLGDKVASPKKSKASSVDSSAATSPASKTDAAVLSPRITERRSVDTESELAKLEEEFREGNIDYTSEEVGGWEFDELEQELKSSNSEVNKFSL